MFVGFVGSLFEDSDLTTGTGRTCSEHSREPLVDGCGVNVLGVVNIAGGPVDFLNFLHGFDIPKLKLFGGGIASSKNESVFVVKRLS